MKTVTIGKHKVVFEIDDDRERVWLGGQCLGLLHPRCNDWAQKAQLARLIVRAYSLHNMEVNNTSENFPSDNNNKKENQ